MSHFDIAIVGAGAAGLAAGLALQSSGRNSVVLEARDRIGGRAFTDATTFGFPVDLGAHWLHAATQNPFTKIADRLGINYKSDIGWADVIRFGGGGPLPESLQEEAVAYIAAVLDRLEASTEDVAFSDYLEPGSRWNMLMTRIIAQITSLDPEQCSTRDYARYEGEGGDFPVEDGYGTLVARHAAGLPVTLETPVTHIDWSGTGVRLETTRGTITASKVILAVPVNVLAAGGIRFTPALPARLVEAFHDCPMGVSEKLAIQLDRPIEGLGHLYGDVIDLSGPRAFNLHMNPFGRPLLVSHMGGSYGREMERASDSEVMAIAMEALVDAFGASIRRRVVKSLRTHWASNPWTLGGYSHARPGRADQRLLFSETVGDRIVLAGEHCSIPSFSTVHGAHLSGQEAATKALGLLE